MEKMEDKLTKMIQSERRERRSMIEAFPLNTLPITQGAYEKTFDFGQMYDLITTGSCSKKIEAAAPASAPEAETEKTPNGSSKPKKSWGLFSGEGWGGWGSGLEFYSFLVRKRGENFISDIYLADNQEDNSGGYCEVKAEYVMLAERYLTPRNQIVSGWSHRHPISTPSGTDIDNHVTVLSSVESTQYITLYENLTLDDVVQIEGEDNVITLRDNYSGRTYMFKLSQQNSSKDKLLLESAREKRPVQIGYGYSLILIGNSGRVYPEIFYCLINKEDALRQSDLDIKRKKVEIEIINQPPEQQLRYAYDELVMDILKKIKLSTDINMNKALKNIRKLGDAPVERVREALRNKDAFPYLFRPVFIPIFGAKKPKVAGEAEAGIVIPEHEQYIRVIAEGSSKKALLSIFQKKLTPDELQKISVMKEFRKIKAKAKEKLIFEEGGKVKKKPEALFYNDLAKLTDNIMIVDEKKRKTVLQRGDYVRVKRFDYRNGGVLVQRADGKYSFQLYEHQLKKLTEQDMKEYKLSQEGAFKKLMRRVKKWVEGPPQESQIPAASKTLDQLLEQKEIGRDTARKPASEREPRIIMPRDAESKTEPEKSPEKPVETLPDQEKNKEMIREESEKD